MAGDERDEETHDDDADARFFEKGDGGTDVEGDALAREIEGDRRERADARKRLLLFVPPMAALAIAVASVGLGRPREVSAARLIAGPAPTAGGALHARLVVVRATPNEPDIARVEKMDLRLAGGAHGTATTTDDEGASELVVESPVPPHFTIEGHRDNGWSTLMAVSLDTLSTPDPKDGVIDATRTSGHSDGALQVDVAPENSVLSPPAKSAAWVRVRARDGIDAGRPIANSTIATVSEAGLGNDPVAVITDGAGLARVELDPIAAPVVIVVHATAGDRTGSWRGTLGSVLGVPTVVGDGVYLDGPSPRTTLAIEATSSRPRAYVDLWHQGVRVMGSALVFDGRVATVPLPVGLSGVYDLEISGSPEPPTREELGHAATFPIVFAADAVAAWGAIATSPRFSDRVSPSGAGLQSYEPAVAATIARASIAMPNRRVVADGLPFALRNELARGKRTRRAGVFAVVGGALLEMTLLAWLGILSGARRAQAEIDALARGMDALDAHHDAAEARDVRLGARAALLVALAAIGGLLVVFSALGLMAWGLE